MGRKAMVVVVGVAVLVLGLGGCGVLTLGSTVMTMWQGAAQYQAQQEQQASQGFGLSSKVPAQYVPWVMKAGQICPAITPPLVAADDETESGWNPDAVGPAVQGGQHAVGIAQFMPSNFGLIRDEDGNGAASPTDPADEIVAQGRFLCSYAALFSPAYSGEQLQRLTLAAYNAGPGAVLARGCAKASLPACPATMPSDPSVQAYVDKIMSLMASYAAAPATALTGTIGGPWQQPVTSWGTSAVFHQRGPMWHMCGWHTGYDYVVPTGTPVRAIHSGTVVHAGYGGDSGGTGPAYGNQVIVDHGNIDGQDVRSYYDHLSAVNVSVGAKVDTGTLLGMSGATGNVSGPHLHLEMTVGATGMPTCSQFIDPNAYILAHAHDAAATTTTATTVAVNSSGGKAVAAAKLQLGVPYSYGGGGLNGPAANVDGTVGFDCSSLVRYAWYQATSGQVTIDRTSEDQEAHLTPISAAQLQPGDLIYFQINGGGDWNHVGMYVSPGQMIHAPHPGDVVRLASYTDAYYANIPKAYRRVTG